MLQAKANTGELVTLATMSKPEIASLRQTKQFSCPVCNEPVIMKVGSKMIPHFAHRSIQNCPSHEGGEGLYHEKGKLLLYKWLKHQHLDVQLEAYLPDIMQRPDLLVAINKKVIAIEFQCARISLKEIHWRNKGYKKAGITPIWILGASRMQRRSKHQLKIDQFQLQFMHQFSSEFPLTLFFLCPDTLQFISFQDIFFTRTDQAIGKLHMRRLDHMIFTDLFQGQLFDKKELYLLWKKEKRAFRLKPIKHRHGREYAWNQWLYLKQTHREHLPSLIHLPVNGQYLMKSALWDWQSRLCLEVLAPLPLGRQFTVKKCTHLLRNHSDYSTNFSLIKPIANPLHHYLQMLDKLGFVRQESSQHFTKVNPIYFYQNVEDALAGDEEIMNQLMNSEQNTGMNVN